MSQLIPFREDDPFREMMRMMDAMRNWMERAFFAPLTTWPTLAEVGTLAVNVREDENNVVVETAIPGVSEDDIDINVQGDTLTITAEAKAGREESREGWHLRELRYGKCSRAVRLPAEVNAEKATAELSNGILTITLPKAKPSPVHKIAVKAGKLLKGGK